MEFDSFTKTGALRIASAIQLYWALRGVDGISTWIAEIPGFPGHYQVRSNIAERFSEYPYSHAVLQ